MPVYNVLIGAGYVESESNARLWMNYANKKAKTPQEIFDDFKKVLFAYVQLDEARRHDCPPPPPEANFCPQCGRQCLDEPEITQRAADAIRHMVHGTTVDLDEDLISLMEKAGFKIWGDPVTGKIVFIDQADTSLERDYLKPSIRIQKVTFKEDK